MSNNVKFRGTFDDKVSGTLDKLRTKFDQIGGKGSSASLFGNVGAKAMAAGLTMIGSAASIATDFLGHSITAASNLTEATTKSQAVFGDSAGQIETWAETASRSFGQSKRSALEAAGTFGNLIQAFGIGGTKAGEMSKTLVELASDLASFNNTSVDEAIQALRSGLSGETEPLKRYGVALNDVRLKEEALRMGLIKTTSGVLPITIKTQAAYSLILKDTALAQGDFARTADGMANQMKTLAAQAEDTSAKFGEVLLPIVVEFQRTVITALDRSSIAWEDMEAAAKKGSQSAQGEMRALQAIADEMGVGVETAFNLVAQTGTHDMKTLRMALNGYSGEMRETAGEVDTAGADMERTFEDLTKVATDQAQAMIDGYFDPIEIRARIYQSRLSQNAAEEKLRDAKTKREKREAADDIVASISDQADALNDLAKKNKLTAKDIDRFEKDVKESYDVLGKKVPPDIQAIITKMRALAAFDNRVVNVKVWTKFQMDNSPHRAMGGPVKAGQVYTVGERGPELFVSERNGTIIPNHALSGMVGATAGGGGGGMGGAAVTLVYAPTYSSASPAEAQRFAREILPAVLRESTRQGYAVGRSVG